MIGGAECLRLGELGSFSSLPSTTYGQGGKGWGESFRFPPRHSMVSLGLPLVVYLPSPNEQFWPRAGSGPILASARSLGLKLELSCQCPRLVLRSKKRLFPSRADWGKGMRVGGNLHYILY